MRAALIVVLALAPALAPALVQAQEPYTHRFLVEGRLIGANGAPIAGTPVAVTGPAGDLTRSCVNVVDNATTDEWGDFALCFEQGPIHDGVVTVRLGDHNETRNVDQNFRRLVVFARDPTRNGTAPPEWNTTFRIAGRVLVPGSVEFGGYQAYGLPVANESMNVTVRTPNATSVLPLRTDGNGDFDAVIRLLNASDETQARATLAIHGQHLNRYLDPEFHRINVRLGVQSGAGSDVQSSFDDGFDTATPQPGATTPRASVGLILLAAAALGVAVYAVRRAARK